MKKKLTITILLLLIIAAMLVGAKKFKLWPFQTYTSESFGIEVFVSPNDADHDGIDDQRDILINAKEYIETKPKYKSQYYASGYPDDDYGVCTDVVAQALLHAGYDLQQLVDEDRRTHPNNYRVEPIDKNIDFRRVRNLDIYFKNNWTSLTIDSSEIDQWQGGDIVVYPKHIGIVSDKRNKQGIPLIIHHGSSFQWSYEEDRLDRIDTIIGHYRIVK